MTYGYLAALVQTNLVRLIAYSSVAQSGYFLMGVVALGASGFAVPGILVFAAAYVAMNLGAFAVVLLAGRDLGDLEGFGRNWAGAAMVVFLLSLTGIPPFFGFVGTLSALGSGRGRAVACDHRRPELGAGTWSLPAVDGADVSNFFDRAPVRGGRSSDPRNSRGHRACHAAHRARGRNPARAVDQTSAWI